MKREGFYPAPPFWPEKLCSASTPERPHPLDPLVDSDAVQHDYIADGWPGPCSISFRDGSFLSWWPSLTIERAEAKALDA